MVSFKAIVIGVVLAATTFIQPTFTMPTGDPTMTTNNFTTITGNRGISTCHRELLGGNFSLDIHADASAKIDGLPASCIAEVRRYNAHSDTQKFGTLNILNDIVVQIENLDLFLNAFGSLEAFEEYAMQAE
jgi:hypothetical protein